jgi:hypothetical protein
MRVAANQRKGLDCEPLGLIGSGGSPDLSHDEYKLILRTAANPRKGLAYEPLGLIGSGGSLLFRKTAKKILAGDSTVS